MILFTEKTAIAFKKSKAASAAKLDDINASSSMTSLAGSGQRKPDEVSFLGEISDEESSDSDSELEKVEEEDLVERKNSQSSEASVRDAENRASENNRTDKESSELKGSSNVIENSADKDTMDTSKESSSIDESEGKNELQDQSQLTGDSVGADKNTSAASDASSGNADLSAVIGESEGKNDSSQLSSNSVDPEKGNSGVDESPASETDLTVMMEKSGGKMSVDNDSSAKKEDCNRDEKSCVKGNVREFVEGSLGGEGTVADGCKDKRANAEETEMECCSEQKEIDGTVEEAKRENVNEGNEKELTNVESSVCQSDKQNAESDLSVEKNNSQGQPEEELPKEQEDGKDQTIPLHEIQKQQENEVQLHGESRQPDEDSKEQSKEEIHEQQNSTDTELNNERDSGNESASVIQGGGVEL